MHDRPPDIHPELAQAIFNVQTTANMALKDANNPHFKSKYADLNAVWDAIREPLKKNNLCVLQSAERLLEDGKVCGINMVTMIVHTSGHVFSTVCAIPAERQDPQKYGSAITYARRYGLCAALGVLADDDDDAQAAVEPSKAKATVKAPPKMTHMAVPLDHPTVAQIKDAFNVPTNAEQWNAAIAKIKTKKQAENLKESLVLYLNDQGFAEAQHKTQPLYMALAEKWRTCD